MLYKAVDFVGNTKDIDMGKRTAILKYATYNSLDRDKDRANKGMFTKSWNEGFQDIRFFRNHDKKEAPGRPVRFWEDNNHAYAEVKLGTHTLGEDTLKMMDEGIITNNSYGFDPVPERTTKIKGNGNDFKEVKLWEISVLTHWGAHPGSLVESVTKSDKGLSDENVEALRMRIKTMETFCRNTKASDETIINILEQITSAEEILKSYDTVDTRSDDDQDAQSISVNKEREAAEALLLLTLKF